MWYQLAAIWSNQLLPLCSEWWHMKWGRNWPVSGVLPLLNLQQNRTRSVVCPSDDLWGKFTATDVHAVAGLTIWHGHTHAHVCRKWMWYSREYSKRSRNILGPKKRVGVYCSELTLPPPVSCLHSAYLYTVNIHLSRLLVCTVYYYYFVSLTFKCKWMNTTL